jgi:hypothetical protein
VAALWLSDTLTRKGEAAGITAARNFSAPAARFAAAAPAPLC